MTPFLCGPRGAPFDDSDPNRLFILDGGSSIGQQWAGKDTMRDINRICGTPDDLSIDVLATFFSICAVDRAVDRDQSADGWTRQIALIVSVTNPIAFETAKDHLIKAINFLSGDFWSISFVAGPSYAHGIRRRSMATTCNSVSLLSGGMDSLIGLIEHVHSGNNPLLVSHTFTGHGSIQEHLGSRISPSSPHVNTSLSPTLTEKPGGPPSQRARSLSFLGLAIACAGTNSVSGNSNGGKVLYMPENGFISLNPPLTISRIGSHSTRTTHPTFLNRLGMFLRSIGCNVEIKNPYRFKTKGEMLHECSNQSLCRELIHRTISCGRYGQNKREHCGTCVPCLIRRAAFQRSGIPDQTLRYTNAITCDGNPGGMSGSICDVIHGIHKFRKTGAKRMIAPYLSQEAIADLDQYGDVASRGFEEVSALFRGLNVG